MSVNAHKKFQMISCLYLEKILKKHDETHITNISTDETKKISGTPSYFINFETNILQKLQKIKATRMSTYDLNNPHRYQSQRPKFA